MKELGEYYNNWKSRAWKICLTLWVVLILVFYFANAFVSTFANLIAGYMSLFLTCDVKFVEYLLTVLIDFIAPTSITIGMYFGILKYVNEKGWKRKYPQYDIDGEWDDITTYTRELCGSGWKDLNRDGVPSPVHIKQTCQSIKIESSVGEDFEWHSLLADWDDSNSIRIFYIVEYYANLQTKGYPERRMGYEYMTVDRRSVAPNKKPTKLVGKFWHCLADDGKPMYKGDATYTRRFVKE